jgi:hypothetical protein
MNGRKTERAQGCLHQLCITWEKQRGLMQNIHKWAKNIDEWAEK